MPRLGEMLCCLLLLSLSGCAVSQVTSNSVSKPNTALTNSRPDHKIIDEIQPGAAGTSIHWESRPQIGSVAFNGVNSAWLLTDRKGDLISTQNVGEDWDKLSADVYDSSTKASFRQISFIN